MWKHWSGGTSLHFKRPTLAVPASHLAVFPVAGRGDAANAWWNCAGAQHCRLIPLGQLSCVNYYGDQRLLRVDLRT